MTEYILLWVVRAIEFAYTHALSFAVVASGPMLEYLRILVDELGVDALYEAVLPHGHVILTYLLALIAVE